MERKLRIYFNTNAVWATSGYSNQALQIVPRIKEAGFPVAMGCFYGLEGGIVDINGIRMYPKMADPWGGDGMVYHAKDFRADIVFGLQDIWVLNPQFLQQINRWIPILPVDHEPIPPAVLERAKMAYRIVTYSKFGQKEIEKSGLYSTYIPHTVDTNIFKPMDKKEARDKLKLPQDRFIFGMVAANKDNPPRKSFQEVMDAFVQFIKIYPNSAIYFHTLLQQQGGFPIEEYAKRIGIEKNIFYTPVYDLMFHCDRKAMNVIYNSFDCLVTPSLNEGFGVPIIEAQACGVPVIINDFSAMPELIIERKTGFKCKVHYKRFTPIGSWVGIPDMTSIYNCMINVYKADKEKMGKEARKWIVDNYDTDKIFDDKWLNFLDTLEKEIYN